MTGARRRRLLWLVPVVALVAIGLAPLVRYQGIVFPVRIASGSMAGQLLGPHRLVTCKQCGFAFRCGLDTEVPLEQATCPNCGFQHNDLALATPGEGDRVLIDRWAYLRGAPQRGDVVAFVDPTNKTELAVKRIMGLPRESLTIRRGELLMNGRLHRKSLEEMKQLATLVYDDTFRPADEHELPRRWRSDDFPTGWRTTGDGYEWRLPRKAMTADDWLMYRHWRCYASPHPRTDEAPVTDNDAYNQGLSRELHEVTDLLLSCDVTLTLGCEVIFLIHDGRERLTAVLSTQDNSLCLYRSAELLHRGALPSNVDPQKTAIEFGVIDQQLLLAIAGQTVVRREYTPLDVPLQPTSRPMGIAVRRGPCSVTNIRVYRDIFYLNPLRGDWAWSVPAPLGDDAYLVLGDNSPLSNDSRHWPAPGLRRADILGKVLLPRR